MAQVAPLSQYSAEDGKATPWHLSQIGGWVTRGPGLTIIEGTAVSKNGRLGPNGMGLWKEEQVESLKEIVDFTHSQVRKVLQRKTLFGFFNFCAPSLPNIANFPCSSPVAVF